MIGVELVMARFFCEEFVGFLGYKTKDRKIEIKKYIYPSSCNDKLNAYDNMFQE